jgi:phosphoglycolate phosphatase
LSHPVRAVVFDLDGTLIDGYDAIHEALAFALGRMGLPAPGPARVREMVGHGLESLFAQAAGPDRAEEGVRLFRDHYPEVAVSGSRLLPGVQATLDRLAASGLALALASNKPPRFSRMILEARGIASMFAAVAGPDDTHPPKPDASMLAPLLAAMGSRASETVCVGDMEVDVQFARAGGCRAVVLPTGSRTEAYLRGAGADALIAELADLPDALARLGATNGPVVPRPPDSRV